MFSRFAAQVQPLIAYPVDSLNPTLSTVVVGLLAVGILAALATAFFSLRRSRRRERIEREALERIGTTRLAPGPVLLRGRVRVLLEPEHSAVEEASAEAVVSPAPLAVELLQRGTEWNLKGADRGWQYRWTEVSRRTMARPFYLELESGERVRVEPDQRTLLADDISGSEIIPIGGESDEKLRRRRLELVPGRTAYVSGVLEHGHDPAFAGRGGYRDGGDGLVLRPPSDSPMVASSAPLTSEHQQRARFHRGWMLTLLVPLLLVQVGLLGAFHLLSLSGKTVIGEKDRPSWDRPLRAYRSNGLFMYAHYRDDAGSMRALKDVVSEWPRTGGCFHSEPSSAYFRVVSFAPAIHQIGPRATVSPKKLAIGALLELTFLVVYALSTYATRPWYRQRRYVEVGVGRL